MVSTILSFLEVRLCYSPLSTAVFAEISSYIDAESSDDDVYCDSINPDQVETEMLK